VRERVAVALLPVTDQVGVEARRPRDPALEERGSESATMAEERRFPRKMASTTITRMSPCQRAVVTVPVARSTSPDCS
jgi:hypothetical protein